MYQYVKRVGDLLFSIVGLLVLAPLFLVIMFTLRFTGEGEVFYRQERMGWQNKKFGILKFATMLKNSLETGSKTITVRNDPRITKVGKYLRFLKLNELPQIVNVLLGDMSLVGPRPLLVASFYKYTQDVQEIIYKNRPGITGLGSLVFRDEEKLVSACKQKGGDPMEFYIKYIYPYKGDLEKWYYTHASFGVDLKILILTFISLLKSDSDLVFRFLPGIPAKPQELTVGWIQQNEFLP